MNRRFSSILFLVLFLSATFVVAGTTKITIRMGDDYDALVRVKEGDTVIDTPKIKNYPMGLAELSYDTSRSQADYLILIHNNGEVVDSYLLDNIDTGSDLKVDFRSGVPPTVTDIVDEAGVIEEVVEAVIAEETVGENLEASVEETIEDLGFDFSGALSTGKAVFYSEGRGFTTFSWVLLGVVGLGIIFLIFGRMKSRSKSEVEKYVAELESIRRKIRKKIREVKILRNRGIKVKKMIELEEGILEEKKDLGNIEKEVDEEDLKRAKGETVKKSKEED